ncbi:MAG TPA: hypothetical protein DCM86_14310 [Verrucomicrobiales bacterium]|nr:hypothetical protein [Verrucomicrobiales bacterium]
MSFLAPLFLVGAVAVGLPILFHMIRKTIREKQVFSSLMFLLPTPPKLTRQSRLENLLLLLLRCAVVILLALAFARPLIQKGVDPDPAAGAGRQVALLVDTSASMRREDLWAQALEKARTLAEAAGPGDLVALYTYDRHLHPVVTFERARTTSPAERKNLLREAIAGLKPGWGRADLGPAVIATAELFESATGTSTPTPGAERRIELVSDLAEGSRLDGLQGHEWPRDLKVSLNRVKPKLTTNAGLQLLPERGAEEAADGATLLRFRAMNASDAQREQFHLRVRGGATNTPATLDLYVPPGQSRALSVSLSGTEPAELQLEGDDADFDNRVSWVPPLQEAVRILYVGTDAPTDPNRSAYYLQRAFNPTRHRRFEILPSSSRRASWPRPSPRGFGRWLRGAAPFSMPSRTQSRPPSRGSRR